MLRRAHTVLIKWRGWSSLRNSTDVAGTISCAHVPVIAVDTETVRSGRWCQHGHFVGSFVGKLLARGSIERDKKFNKPPVLILADEYAVPGR